MRLGLLAAIAVGLLASPLLAATQEDFDACRSRDPERQIAGCGQIVAEPLFPAHTRARLPHSRPRV